MTAAKTELPSFAAAALLADAWAPALDRSYRLGYANGYRRGRSDEQRDQQAEWTAVAHRVRIGANDRRQHHLEQIRNGEDHTPCMARCEACSRCIHATAWAQRGGRQYLGAQLETDLAWTVLL